MRFRFAFVFYLAAAVAVLLVTMDLVSRSQERAAGDVADAVPHFQTAPQVRVKITEEPQVSRGQEPMLVQLESGTLPADAWNITVLSDENCQPDEDGVSHCLNRIRYQTEVGVGQASLRHHHRMAEEPCLAPGQILEVADRGDARSTQTHPLLP